MGSPVSLRDDFDAEVALVSCETDAGRQVKAVACWRWLRSTTVAHGVMRRGLAVSVCRRSATGCCGSTPRGRPGLSTARRRGKRRSSTRPSDEALARIVESGPIPAVHGVVRWRLLDLAQWVWDEFRISIAKQTLSRELRAMGFRKLSARPRHHAQDEHAIEAFKKTSPPLWRTSRGGRPRAHG